MVFYINCIALTCITTLTNFWLLIMYLFLKKNGQYNLLTYLILSKPNFSLVIQQCYICCSCHCCSVWRLKELLQVFHLLWPIYVLNCTISNSFPEWTCQTLALFENKQMPVLSRSVIQKISVLIAYFVDAAVQHKCP